MLLNYQQLQRAIAAGAASQKEDVLPKKKKKKNKTNAHYKRTAAKLVKYNAKIEQLALLNRHKDEALFGGFPSGNILSVPGIIVFMG